MQAKILISEKYPNSTQEDRKSSQHDWKIVDWDVKHQHKQRNYIVFLSDNDFWVPYWFHKKQM